MAQVVMPCWSVEQCAAAQERWNESVGEVTYTHDISKGLLTTHDVALLMEQAARAGLCVYLRRVYVDGRDTAVDIGLDLPADAPSRRVTRLGPTSWSDARIRFVPRVWPRRPIFIVPHTG
jgi:hypothetical protein